MAGEWCLAGAWRARVPGPARAGTILALVPKVEQIVNENTKETMQKILTEIQSGEFAKDFMNDCNSGGQKMSEYRKKSSEHSIESVGEELRSMMPWISANKIVDKAKN